MEKTLISGTQRQQDTSRPDPAWVVADCPCCGSPVVSNCWRVGGKGYVIIHHCWNALGPVEERTCDYQRPL